jgi:hypothetical protein
LSQLAPTGSGNLSFAVCVCWHGIFPVVGDTARQLNGVNHPGNYYFRLATVISVPSRRCSSGPIMGTILDHNGSVYVRSNWICKWYKLDVVWSTTMTVTLLYLPLQLCCICIQSWSTFGSFIRWDRGDWYKWGYLRDGDCAITSNKAGTCLGLCGLG